MDPLLLARVLRFRSRLRGHERWSRERLLDEQARALTEVRQYAVQRSPFYRELHKGLDRAPLAELPIVTKHMLMTRFDEVVTDRTLRLSALQSYLASASEQPYERRYWVSSTSGTSGKKAIVPSDRSEWSTIIGSYARASDWSGGRLHVWTHSKMAVVSSTTPWHQSSRVARSVRSPFAASVRYDANMPLAQLVSALNEQQPHVLIGYASVLKLLAVEQLEGRLRIHPRSVDASSEVFTSEARGLVARAFGLEPFEVYAATETGGIAAECERHEGLHLFEDLLIVEPVDDKYRPVPIGEVGARTLVTVLHARTLPLIRYELTDRVRLTTRRCSCALPFALIESVEGRSDDVLSLPGADGSRVAVHPVLFERLLDDVAPAGWQVGVDDGGIVVRLRVSQVPEQLGNQVREALSFTGVPPDTALRVEAVDDIPVGAAGKRPRFVHSVAG